MNKVRIIIYKVFLLTVSLFYCDVINAYDFEVDGICYSFINANSVEVAYKWTTISPDPVPTYYSGDVVVPETVSYDGKSYSVVYVGYKAFSTSRNLKTVSLPKSITNIKSSAFEDCGSLTSVKMSENITEIGSSAFKNCKSLKSIDIPKGVTSIGFYVFQGCNSFVSFKIPDHITEIDQYAFIYCNNLESVYIPSSVKTIGSNAFKGCLKLSSLIISNGVTKIGIESFYKCAIDTLTIPESITQIGSQAFYWCPLSLVKAGMKQPPRIDMYCFDGKVLKVPSGTKEIYEKTLYWKDNFNEIIELGNLSTHSLSIKVIGNGIALYNNTTIRNKTSSFTVNEGANATIAFTPDNGYRIKSLKVNNSDVTSSITNNQYTVSNIKSNTTIEVEFEAIPPTTYTLSIKATGNGAATYNGTAIRSKTSTFAVNEGTNATITFTSDVGYRIKSLKVNNSDVTAGVTNGQYTISSIKSNTTVEVEFEAIPPTTYTLSIKATGNGSASYSGTTIRGKTSTFTVNEGSNAAITFAPDNGYRIKSVKVNNADVTSSLSNNSYTINNISENTNVEVEFEVIPATTYTLSITASGNGSASYDGTSIRSKTSTFTVNEGTNVTISFAPDNGYRIKSVKVNNADVTSSVSNNSYTISDISRDTNVEVEFEAVPATTYTLSITASGNGSASYNGTSIRSKTSTFTVNEGTNVSITFTPDNGYRIKSVKENNTIVTSYVSNNTYTINNISRNTTVEVEFEAIPQTTYTLTIAVSGGGSVYYEGETINNSTNYYTVNDGTYATIYFTPDDGYRLKSVKENYYDVTSQIGSNSYTTYISGNTSIEVEFEEISVSTYSLSVKASGSGSVSYNGSTVRNRTTSFTVEEGTNATITFTPDNGYRLKSVVVNNYNVTSSVSNNSYTISYINRDTNVEVEFEAIPATTYTLSVKAVGSGSASYNGTIVRDKTSTFSVSEGTNATITFTPDNGYRIKSLVVNNADVTSYISNNSYTINSIAKNTTLVVEFEAEPTAFAVNGVNYAIRSNSEKTVAVSRGNYGAVLDVPAKVTYQNAEWKVTSIESNALSSSPDLCAIIWNPEVAFTENVRNPNLLLYVKSEDYAPTAIKNVVVNGSASSITLTDAASGNNFYCPEEFTAKSVSYTHHYTMDTGLGESKGWETIALPFDVQKISHQSKGEIVPFANWKSGDSKKPFWLMEFGNSGWKDANSIKAYTPYIISMPNHEKYKADYKLNGNVTFSAANVKIGKTQNYSTSSYSGKTFIPNYSLQTDRNCLALNVNNDYITYQGSDWGSKFSSGRDVHPFEAYMTTASGARSIAISDDMTTTGIRDIMEMYDEQKGVRVYNLKGQLIKTEDGKSLDQVKKTLPAGVYIVNGQKVIIK